MADRQESAEQLAQGRRLIVTLCYDGGSPSHLKTVAPCLEALGLRATFYASSTALLDDPERWRALARDGHEIGLAPLHDWVGDDGVLEAPPEAVAACAEDDAELLRELFGEQPRTIGLPILVGGPPRLRSARSGKIADELPETIRALGCGVRTGLEGSNDPLRVDLGRIRCLPAVEGDSASLVATVEAHRDRPAWLVFAFLGVGSGEDAIDAVEHASFCLWLAENRNALTVLPLRDVCLALASRPSGTAAVGRGRAKRGVVHPS